MTEQEQQIAIAEACGWKECNQNKGRWYPQSSLDFRRELPDYLHDLNAMHEAEELVIESYDMERYVVAIRDICRRDWIGKEKNISEFNEYQWIYSDCHSTASQRAEAFLRTVEKWKD